MKRIIVDFAKLTHEVLELLVEKYPDGYDEDNCVTFRNAHNDLVECLEVKTEDTVYLVKVSAKLANAMDDFDSDDDNDDGDMTNELPEDSDD